MLDRAGKPLGLVEEARFYAGLCCGESQAACVMQASCNRGFWADISDFEFCWRSISLECCVEVVVGEGQGWSGFRSRGRR